VALTLPEDVIAALGRLDDDLARAVVRLSQPLVDKQIRTETVELSQYHDDAVIVVRPTKVLERLDGVSLVPLPDGRALISLDESMTIADFELNLRYVLDAEQDLAEQDRSVVASIADILRHARQTKGMSLHERSIIVLKVNGRHAAGPKPPSPAARRARVRRPK
jgi:hypothetical protein